MNVCCQGSQGIDSKGSIPPAYVACRYDNPIPTWFLTPHDCSKIPALDVHCYKNSKRCRSGTCLRINDKQWQGFRWCLLCWLEFIRFFNTRVESRPNWDIHPLTRNRVYPPPPLVPGGHIRLRVRGWGVPIPTRGQTLWYSRYIPVYTLCAVTDPAFSKFWTGTRLPRFPKCTSHLLHEDPSAEAAWDSWPRPSPSPCCNRIRFFPLDA